MSGQDLSIGIFYIKIWVPGFSGKISKSNHTWPVCLLPASKRTSLPTAPIFLHLKSLELIKPGLHFPGQSTYLILNTQIQVMRAGEHGPK